MLDDLRLSSFGLATLCATGTLLSACGGGSVSDDAAVSTTEDTGVDAYSAPRRDAAVVPQTCAPTSPIDPYRLVPSSEIGAVRGWQVRRGVVHVHTVHSHDACDGQGFMDAEGEPNWETGTRNEQCWQDLRDGLCETYQDFAFLTDHRDYHPDFEYEDLLLAGAGDDMVTDPMGPTANRMRCDDEHRVLLTTGIDYDVLGFGMDHQPGDTPEARRAVYEDSNESFDAMRAAGGVVFAGYVPRQEPVENLWTLSFEGLEVYNPVFNLQSMIGPILSYVTGTIRNPLEYPVPELGFYAFFEETEITLRRWAEAVQHRRLPSILGSNAHRNVFNMPLPDGDRIDSYRRTFHWFSNYVLVRESETVDAALIEARVREGMSYGVFDYLGYAEGFDYHATVGGEVFEMGSEVPAGTGTVLRASTPHVLDLPSDTTLAPTITTRIVRARTGCPLDVAVEAPDHCWEEIARGSGELMVEAPEAGVYRAEVRILPTHLRDCLGPDPDTYLREVLWVYGNAIYVGMDYP